MAIDSGMQIMLTRGSDASSLDQYLENTTDDPDNNPGDTMHLACPRSQAMFTESETNISIVQAMAALSLRQRRVLDLLYAEELTVRQTGARMSISPAMVIKNRDAAFDTLRSLLPSQ